MRWRLKISISFTSQPFNTETDHTVIVEAKFSIQYDSTNPAEAYFFVGLEFNHTGKQDVLAATFHTNLAIGDQNGDVQFVGYGVVYGTSEADLAELRSGLTTNSFENKDGESHPYGSQGNIVYICHSCDGDVWNPLTGGNGTYRARYGCKEEEGNCQRQAFAFAILKINGEEYVFTSEVKKDGSDE